MPNDQKPTTDQLLASIASLQEENRELVNMILKEVQAHQNTRDRLARVHERVLELSAALPADASSSV